MGHSYLMYYMTGFIMIPVFLFALACQFSVKSNFNKYSKIANSRGMTGADAAFRLLQLNGITDVRIKVISGTLTDYYDPKNKEICLSQDVFSSRSIAAIGVACHEAGHACQHAQGYAPLKIRNAVIPARRSALPYRRCNQFRGNGLYRSCILRLRCTVSAYHAPG